MTPSTADSGEEALACLSLGQVEQVRADYAEGMASI